MSVILTKRLMSKAMEICTPMINGFLVDQVLSRLSRHKQRKTAHVCIAGVRVLGETFDASPYYEKTFGELSEWPAPFNEIALNKAQTVWRTGMSTREVLTLHPELFLPDDYKYPGGILFNNAVITSCSGLEPEDDEAVAGIVGSMTYSLVQRVARAVAEQDDLRCFTPESVEQICDQVL